MDHQFVAHAQRSYMTILADEPGSPCATAGMRHVVAQLCQRADKLRVAGLAEEARRRYSAILAGEVPDWNRGDGPPWDLRCAIGGLSLLEEDEAAPEPERGPRGKPGPRGEPGPPGRVVVVSKRHRCEPPGCGSD
jgi:hypothetical protein